MIDSNKNSILRKGTTVLVVTATLASLATATAATMGIQNANADDSASQEQRTDTFTRNFVASTTAVVSKGAGQEENQVAVDANGNVKSDLGTDAKEGYMRVTLDKARTTLTDVTFTLNDGVNASGTVKFLDEEGHELQGADITFDTTTGKNAVGQKITVKVPDYVLGKGVKAVAVNLSNASTDGKMDGTTNKPHTVGFKHFEVNGTYKVAQEYLIKDKDGKDIAGQTIDVQDNGKAVYHTGDTAKVYVKTPTADVEQDFTMTATNGATVTKGAVVNDEKSPLNGYTEFDVTLTKPGSTTLKVTSPSDKNKTPYETDVTLKAYDVVAGIDHVWQMPQHVVSGDHATLYANVSGELALQTTKWEIVDGAGHATITPSKTDTQAATLVGGEVTESTRLTVRAVALDTMADPSKPSTDAVNKDAKYTEFEVFVDAPEVKDGAAVAGLDTTRVRVGENAQTLNLVDATGKNITRSDTEWFVDAGDSNVTVSKKSNGTASIEFKNPGKATVTAKVDGKTFSREIDVLKAAPTKATLKLAKADAFVGETVKATVTYSNPNYKDVDTTTTWTSSDPKTATVDKDGNVKVLKAGKVTITATGALGKATATATLNTWVRPVTVNVTPSDAEFDGWLTLPDETSVQLTAKSVDANGSDAGVKQGVTWKSSDTKVATVDANGVVTAIKAGHVKITATSTADAKAVGSYNLSVDGKAAPLTVTVKNPTTSAFKVGDQTQLLAYDQDGETTPVVWSTSDEKVATVNADGVVTAVAPGEVTITATYNKNGKETKAALALNLVDESGTPASGSIKLTVVAKDAGGSTDPDTPDVQGEFTTEEKAALAHNYFATGKDYTKLSDWDTNKTSYNVKAADWDTLTMTGAKSGDAKYLSGAEDPTGWYDADGNEVSFADRAKATTYKYTFKGNVSGATITYTATKVADAVNPEPGVTNLTINATGYDASKGVEVGKSFKLAAVDQDGKATDVTWTSGDEKVATVDKDGTVKAVAEGAVTITATWTDSTGNVKTPVTATFNVNVVNAGSTDNTPSTGTTVDYKIGKGVWGVYADKDGKTPKSSVGNEKGMLNLAPGKYKLTVTGADAATGTYYATSHINDEGKLSVMGVTPQEVGFVADPDHNTNQQPTETTLDFKQGSYAFFVGGDDTTLHFTLLEAYADNGSTDNNGGDEVTKTHTVTLDYGHDDLTKTFKVKDGDTLATENKAATADPTLDGYTFAGWTVEGGDDNKAIDLSTYKITSDVQFNAHWSRTVSNDGNDSSNGSNNGSTTTNGNASTKSNDSNSSSDLAKTGATVGIIGVVMAGLTAAGVGLRKMTGRRED